MKVSELKYERVTLEEITQRITVAVNEIKSAKTVDAILSARGIITAAISDYSTAASLSYMRYSINTADKYYLGEKDYYDEIGPKVDNLCLDYAKAMLSSPLRPQLEQALSPVLFKSFEVQVKSISPEIIDDMIEENRLVTEYSQLMASMEFEFRGNKLPRPMLMKYTKDDDRATRREAYWVLGRTLETHRNELDSIFDKLVHVRDRMAKKMGFKNFVELGYNRMGRLCYNEAMVKDFRENNLKDIVPIVARLKTENAKRLGIDNFKLYDDGVTIPGGDPKPSANKDDIFNAAKEMYHAMSPETGKFIDMMLENEAFDVESRKNKWGGGYCTEFKNYRQPFILANFNGTSGDVDVVTHEAGHAFAYYMTANSPFDIELSVGGMETAETHSMSMEFFAWKYMDKFFGKDADKYRFMHAFDAFSFIPYGTIVDYFQHIVYENPDMTPTERNTAWLELEHKFRPYMDADGIPYIEEGTRWQYQMHIYESPFYYIDYCLAQVAAFQFLLLSRKDYNTAFAKYVHFLSQGGEKVFTDLLAEAELFSPFAPGALKPFARDIEKLFDEIRV